MKSSILCVIDFSDSSKQVLKQGCELAKQLKYHLRILYCYRLKVTMHGLIGDIKKNKEKEALTQFTALENELIKGFEIEYDFMSEVGFLIDRVENHIGTEQIKFLIIDKNMKIEHEEIFSELLEHTRVPIILVSAGEFLNKTDALEVNKPAYYLNL